MNDLFDIWQEAQNKAYEKAWMTVRMMTCPKCFRQNRALRGRQHAVCRSYYAAADAVWSEWGMAKQATAMAKEAQR